MNKLKKFYYKYNLSKYLKVCFCFFIILFWAFFTIKSRYWQLFNTDEIHHWNIAKDLSIVEIIKLMRYEGHTLLWYLCLKPFTYNDLFFPYIVKMLNWFFIFGALVIFWIFSPINNFIKLLITFSYPFLSYFPLLGRCYGLSILFLVLLCTLYKKRLKNPILFSILIVLTANTHIIAAIPAFYLGLILCFDLIKNKQIKHLIISLFIFLLCCILFFIQWHNHVTPAYINDTYIQHFYLFQYLLMFNKYYNSETLFAIIFNNFLKTILIFTPFITFWYLKNNDRVLFFIFYSWFTLFLLLMFPYRTYEQHIYFMYIYLIMAYWLSLYNKNIDEDKHRVFKVIFSILFIFLFQFFRTNYLGWAKHINEYISVKNDMEKIVPQGSTVYTRMSYVLVLMNYIRDNYILNNLEGESIHSLKSYERTWEYDELDFKNKLYDNFKVKGDDITSDSYILLFCNDKLKRKLTKYKVYELGTFKKYCIYKIK